MYTNKKEFSNDLLPDVLDTPLNLRHTSGGIFTHEGKTPSGVRVKVESTMNDVADLNYFYQETLSELVESIFQ